MAKRTIREIGDPILLKKAKQIVKIDDKLKELIDDMYETMYDANGVGLAGPQVGVLKRVVVVDCSEEQNEPITLINPQIIEKDGTQTGDEGCLSVPGKVGVVTRPMHVVVKSDTMDGKTAEYEGEGLLARAFCHEIDHLDGVLYVSKVEGELRNAGEDTQEEE
jgi:peptide deformylase